MNKKLFEELSVITEEDFINHLQEVAEQDDSFGPEEIFRQTKEYFFAKLINKLDRYSISKNKYKYGGADYGYSCPSSGLDVDKNKNGKWIKYDDIISEAKRSVK